ncbi:acylphosphatase [Actinobacillus delphinicola]|uniref:acylphosphatase n=1 Tax=Actinobacillus delphinicola TaxID=51161 RepID=A0A448TVM5_9PAST|nr:acylphosphatase [Actinobacillus delphinicola]VEJ09988.1 acylphosphatase [Actinobacillus delphinicola]
MKVVRILVTGCVQGVGFRFYTKRLADQLELVGTVQNLSNGGVEIIVKGESAIVQKFIDKLPKMNPYARVEDIEVEDVIEKVVFLNFSILR